MHEKMRMIFWEVLEKGLGRDGGGYGLAWGGSARNLFHVVEEEIMASFWLWGSSSSLKDGEQHFKVP